MIFISAGHHPDKPGACFEDFCEHEEAKKWMSLIANRLGHEGMVVPTGTLKNKVGFINERAQRSDIAVEIHFNSAKNAEGVYIGRGSETLYYPSSGRGYAIADSVQQALGGLFVPDRGIKEGYYQLNPAKGPDFFLARTVCTALIIEPEFIQYRDRIINDRERGCELIALALEGYINDEV